MHPFPKSIYEMFDAKRRFVVPLFQRQYVWTKERQWVPLWEDIRRQAELCAPGAETGRPLHFLGAVVISQLPIRNDELKAHQIIDGQQRLTTFQVFLAAFRDVCREVDQATYDDLAALCINTGRMGEPAKERYKLWPTAADVPAFKDVIDCGSAAVIEKKYVLPPPPLKKDGTPKKNVALAEDTRPKLVQAYLFFCSAIRSYVGSGQDASVRAGWLLDAIRNRMKLVSIELEATDDPQVIFETLNARNEPLLPSDLLRNFIFQRAERAGEASSDLYEKHWKPFDELPDPEARKNAGKFWKTLERQGRLKRARLDIFMQHFLSMQTGAEANIGHLFAEYQSWATPKNGAPPFTSVRDELSELTRFAGFYAKFINPDTTTRLGQFAARLRTLETSTFYPLLLELFADEQLPPQELEGIVVDLESFLIRRFICNLTAKNYNMQGLKLLRDWRGSGPVRTRTQFRSLLVQPDGDTTRCPKDDEFRARWISSPVYETLKSPRVEMLLRALNRAQADELGEGILPPSSLSIEHILPQKWKLWPFSTSVLSKHSGLDGATAHRNSLLHTIGNLTLVTKKLNSKLQNGPFSGKKPLLVTKSGLWLNAYFHGVEEWDEDAILKRSASLFEVALKIWPYPGEESAKKAAA